MKNELNRVGEIQVTGSEAARKAKALYQTPDENGKIHRVAVKMNAKPQPHITEIALRVLGTKAAFKEVADFDKLAQELKEKGVKLAPAFDDKIWDELYDGMQKNPSPEEFKSANDNTVKTQE